MRKLLVLFAAFTALLGFSTMASAVDSPEINHAFFFGDCEPERRVISASGGYDFGCRGFGFFFGDHDAESIVEAIQEEAYDQHLGDVIVVKLYAYKFGLGANFVPAITGSEYGSCFENGAEGQSVANDQVPDINGLWIAWFSVEVCDYDDYDDYEE